MISGQSIDIIITKYSLLRQSGFWSVLKKNILQGKTDVFFSENGL